MSDDPPLEDALYEIVAAFSGRAIASGAQALDPHTMRASANAEFARVNLDKPQLARIEDKEVSGPVRDIPIRIYDPGSGLPGAMIHCHGGGWVVGDLESEDSWLRNLALQSGVTIVSVDYALSPEAIFPQAINETIAVANALVEGVLPVATSHGIGFSGCSAGAQVALWAAIGWARGRHSAPALVFLSQGAIDPSCGRGSFERYGDGRYGLSASVMRWFWRVYSAGMDDGALRMPGAEDLVALPRLELHSAELDVLADDSAALERLARVAGCHVVHRRYPGTVHGFTQYFRQSPQSRQALEDGAAAIRQALAGG